MLTTLLRDKAKKLLRLGCSDGQKHDRSISSLREQHPDWTVELWRFERRSLTRSRRTASTTDAEHLDLEVAVTRWDPNGIVTTRTEAY